MRKRTLLIRPTAEQLAQTKEKQGGNATHAGVEQLSTTTRRGKQGIYPLEPPHGKLFRPPHENSGYRLYA